MASDRWRNPWRVWGLALTLALLPAACSQEAGDPFTEAEALIAAGETEQGIERLREAAANDPGNAEIQFSIGMALLQVGRGTEAIFPLRKAAESEEFGIQAGIVLASVLNESGNHEEAIAATDRVLERSPEEAGALLVRAGAALQLHRYEQALEASERLLQLDPDSLAFRHLRAVALAEAERGDEAEAIFLELMAASPKDEPGVAQRACIALAGIYAEAQPDRAAGQLVTCEATLALEPLGADAIVGLYDELGRAEEGTQLLGRVVEQHPDLAHFRGALGSRLIAADRFDEAEALVSQGAVEEWDATRWAVVSSVRRAAGNVEGARDAIDRAIALGAPPDPEHLFVRADLALGLGELAEAEALLARISEPLYERTLRGRLAQERGDPARALEIFDTVLPQWPQNYGVRVFAALAALDLGDRKRAEQELLEATRQAPTETDAAIWLARLQFANGDYADAATMAYRQITERGPTHPDAFLLAARAYAESGQRKGAEFVLDEMAIVREGLFKGHALAERGRMLARRVGPAQALADYDQRIAESGIDLADPANEPALAQLLQLLTGAGELDEAGRRLDRLAAADADRPVLSAMRGRVALLRGDLEAAGAGFDRALALDPELPAALAGQALLLRASGDLAGASEAMDRAWELGRHQDHGYMAARLRLDAGRVDDARSRFEQLLRLHPDHAGAANDLAWLLADRGERLENAERLALLALRLAPGSEVLDTLGYVQLKRGNASGAIGSFRRSLDANPSYATARYHLAVALHEGGRDDEARASLKTALETAFPESDQARALLAKLEGTGGAIP